MNRFQPNFPPGKKFHARRKLLCQSDMGLAAPLAFRAAAQAFCGRFRRIASRFCPRKGAFPLVFLRNLPKLAIGTGVAKVRHAVAKGNQ
jgi:hypothetical protein